MDTNVQKERMLVLAKSDPDRRFEARLARKGYKVVRFGSGADTLHYIVTQEPDVIILNGFALSDMSNHKLEQQINATFPDRKALLMVMYEGNIHEKPVLWNEYGADVYLPRFIDDETFDDIFSKLKEKRALSSTQ